MHALGMDRLPAADEVVVGKYRVVRVIAHGGMGIVIEAHHLRLDRPVALKILHPSVRADYETAARFEREARAAARITGPHVARVLDVDNLEDGSPFIVMELLKGVDLATELSRRQSLPIEEAVGYVLEACDAMKEAHELGIVHRDLKPSNLFLCEQGDRRTLKVLDFGISKATRSEDVAMTSTHSVLGTPLYMSPEQVRSAKHVDARSDIWSLGVILYELLAGRPPFQERTAMAVGAAIASEPAPVLSKYREDAPAGLVDAVMKALEKNPEDRYPDVSAFAAAIAPHGPARGTLSPPVPPVDTSEHAGAWADFRSGRYPRLSATDRTSRASPEASRWRPWAVAALVTALVSVGAIMLSRSPVQAPPTLGASGAALSAAPVEAVPDVARAAVQEAPAASSGAAAASAPESAAVQVAASAPAPRQEALRPAVSSSRAVPKVSVRPAASAPPTAQSSPEPAAPPVNPLHL